ncbi:MAG: SGNH/GDSL hydrolase family protein [Marmoricola sp.]|nr:SGNH/GDSL hydrolase family protein [Marmoricola sp.]
MHPRALVLAVLVALLGLAPAGAARAATNGSMVAFGDSVPSGAYCRCTPFPVLYARKVASRTRRPVRMSNDAVSGATSASVLRQVEQGSARAAIRASGTVLLMIGANDFTPAFRQVLRHERRGVPAYRPVARRVRANLTATIREIQALHPGVRVLVADYWNVVRDGRVGRSHYGAWGMRKAEQATYWANHAIRAAAADRRVRVVSTYVGFKGVHGHRDPTWLLASDGDHPNARGHVEIADQFYAAAPTG